MEHACCSRPASTREGWLQRTMLPNQHLLKVCTDLLCWRLAEGCYTAFPDSMCPYTGTGR